MKWALPRRWRCLACLLLLLEVWSATQATAAAQSLIAIDATSPAEEPSPVPAAMGSSRNPQGVVIGANSQYLTLGGKPWLPVMGELHYSRYPEQQWEQEILKMKAAGVDIVSTYVIWIHQEQNEGEFDWSGQRDLRRFAELCREHGMYLFVRIGPWAHGEVRHGGLPDWVMAKSPVRQNNPVYLEEVRSFYAQIGLQLHGELWKDGGPVIGVQLENEYNLKGPGKGVEHIRTLKAMARAVGLDTPLYTVTGWDGTAIPLDAALPVFGGYPDAPWAGTPGPMPANEVYAFRFGNRAAGNMGAIGGNGQNSSASYKGTPFLTAEVGDGIEDTYFRRPVVTAEDVASIAPVMLGSGVNMLGYYMFHGGRNPDGGPITLQESQRTGYPTDVPVRSYDFQAPLGEFGQERESLRKLKLVHYFLNDFGGELAPMMVHAPDRQPAGPGDNSVPRVAARTLGDAGFVFFSNHVRGLSMPARTGFQVALKLRSGVEQVPRQPIDLPADAFGIWPVNLSMGGTTLRYSTAQLFKRVEGHETSYWFFAIPGIRPEFAFSAKTGIVSMSSGIQRVEDRESVVLRAPPEAESSLVLSDGTRVVIVPEREAEKLWRVDEAAQLVLTSADFFSDRGAWTFESDGDSHIDVGVFHASGTPQVQEGTITATNRGDLFQHYVAQVPPISFHVEVKRVAKAQPRAPWVAGPKFDWRPHAVPLAPDDQEFAGAAAWKVDLPDLHWSTTLSDAFLHVSYQGDAARLYSGGTLIDDNFWNGLPWTVGLREVLAQGQAGGHLQLGLRILPLPRQYPMFLENASQLHFSATGVADTLAGITIVPRYRIVLEQTPAK